MDGDSELVLEQICAEDDEVELSDELVSATESLQNMYLGVHFLEKTYNLGEKRRFKRISFSKIVQNIRRTLVGARLQLEDALVSIYQSGNGFCNSDDSDDLLADSYSRIVESARGLCGKICDVPTAWDLSVEQRERNGDYVGENSHFMKYLSEMRGHLDSIATELELRSFIDSFEYKHD